MACGLRPQLHPQSRLLDGDMGPWLLSDEYFYSATGREDRGYYHYVSLFINGSIR